MAILQSYKKVVLSSFYMESFLLARPFLYNIKLRLNYFHKHQNYIIYKNITKFFRNIALTLFLVSVLFGFAKFISYDIIFSGLDSGSGLGSDSSSSSGSGSMGLVIGLIIPSFSYQLKENLLATINNKKIKNIYNNKIPFSGGVLRTLLVAPKIELIKNRIRID